MQGRHPPARPAAATVAGQWGRRGRRRGLRRAHEGGWCHYGRLMRLWFLPQSSSRRIGARAIFDAAHLVPAEAGRLAGPLRQRLYSQVHHMSGASIVVPVCCA